MKNLSKETLAIVKQMQQSELTESVIYEKIAKFAKGEENKKTLRRLASEERAHCEIWESYTGIKMKPQKAKILKYTLIAPYLLLSQPLVALATMIGIIILIIAGFTYYTSVAQDLKFGTRFLEMAGISIGVAVISFVVGILAKRLLGVDI